MSDDRLAKALMVAIRAHAGQVDKQGEPYLLHVLRVVEAVGDEAKPVAALHDVVEDAGTHLTGAHLANDCELTGEEFWALMALTRSEGEGAERLDGGFYGHTYADYIQHIVDSGGPIALEVKLADLRDNLGRIPREPATGVYTSRLGTVENITERRVYTQWANDWGSLAARYEKAVATLEACGSGSLGSQP